MFSVISNEAFPLQASSKSFLSTSDLQVLFEKSIKAQQKNLPFSQNAFSFALFCLVHVANRDGRKRNRAEIGIKWTKACDNWTRFPFFVDVGDVISGKADGKGKGNKPENPVRVFN